MEVDVNFEKSTEMIDTHSFKMECGRSFYRRQNEIPRQLGSLLFYR